MAPVQTGKQILYLKSYALPARRRHLDMASSIIGQWDCVSLLFGISKGNKQQLYLVICFSIYPPFSKKRGSLFCPNFIILLCGISLLRHLSGISPHLETIAPAPRPAFPSSKHKNNLNIPLICRKMKEIMSTGTSTYVHISLPSSTAKFLQGLFTLCTDSATNALIPMLAIQPDTGTSMERLWQNSGVCLLPKNPVDVFQLCCDMTYLPDWTLLTPPFLKIPHLLTSRTLWRSFSKPLSGHSWSFPWTALPYSSVKW